ncbi:MAG: helix-turn-helix domain-containing protein [Candidatus Thiodiazotropha lotti]|uniref:Helix-turn-helix domain-containing protein n=1 Tax=Candidatus Thiodiazotropha lotti TaxID=2792787 RepID=A0A9E4K5H9_9GAMM|nr:helix-turn-helix domain-containing protein [Candidatus Thiodiazotropha lotti]MCW4203977.1 helix-turn-helix domain-containing protein [Candidatus Thiodiazotropha lotti]
MNSQIHTVNEAMEILRSSRATVYALINSGRLRSFKIGNRRYIRSSAISAFIDSAEKDSAAA